MFGSEAVPAGLFALLICFVPETPRYLVSVGRDSQALGILSRINGITAGYSLYAFRTELSHSSRSPVFSPKFHPIPRSRMFCSYKNRYQHSPS